MKAKQVVHSTTVASNLYGCFSTETKSHQKLSLFYDTAQYNNRQNVAIKMENKKGNFFGVSFLKSLILI